MFLIFINLFYPCLSSSCLDPCAIFLHSLARKWKKFQNIYADFFSFLALISAIKEKLKHNNGICCFEKLKCYLQYWFPGQFSVGQQGLRFVISKKEMRTIKSYLDKKHLLS